MIPLADLNDAVSNLVISIVNIASLLLLVYVLLDLARNFVAGLPEIARTFHNALGRLWEPILAPIRNALPPLGGLDLSPLIVLLLLQFIGNLLV
ncbi:MAG: YggT family protein [Patulibacter minatonensis]